MNTVAKIIIRINSHIDINEEMLKMLNQGNTTIVDADILRNEFSCKNEVLTEVLKDIESIVLSED